jgi:hypothetical protein
LEESKTALHQALTEYPEAQVDIQLMLSFLDNSTRGIVR